MPILGTYLLCGLLTLWYRIRRDQPLTGDWVENATIVVFWWVVAIPALALWVYDRWKRSSLLAFAVGLACGIGLALASAHLLGLWAQ
ncbi:MAG: hypothetical protein ACRENU_10475 [Gemmatimonadaceae bacterium]